MDALNLCANYINNHRWFNPQLAPGFLLVWCRWQEAEPNWMSRIWGWVRAYLESRKSGCRKWRNSWNSMVTSSSSSSSSGLHTYLPHLGCLFSSSPRAFSRSLPPLRRRRREGGRFWWWAGERMCVGGCFCFAFPFSVWCGRSFNTWNFLSSVRNQNQIFSLCFFFLSIFCLDWLEFVRLVCFML